MAMNNGDSYKRWVKLIVLVSIGIGLFAGGILMSKNSTLRWDLTQSESFTFSTRTRTVLSNVKQEVHLYFFRHPSHREENLHNNRNRQSIEDLLGEYANRSRNIHRHILYPSRNRKRIDSLAKKYNLKRSRLEATEPVLVTSEGKFRLLGFQEFHSRVGAGMGGRERTFHTVDFPLGEHLLTNSIRAVTRTRNVQICFSTNQGDRTTRGSGGTDAAPFGLMKRKLIRDEGFKVETVHLETDLDLHNSCDVLVMAGPRQTISEKAQHNIRSFLDSGGSLMLLLEPREVTGLEGLLEPYGISIMSAVLTDQRKRVRQMKGAMEFDRFGDHAITIPLKKDRKFFARNPRILTASKPLDDKTTVSSLILGDPQALWNPLPKSVLHKHNLQSPETVPEPLPIAVSATGQAPDRKKENYHIVAVGATDWASNRFLRVTRRVRGTANMDFFLNSIRWLAGLSEEISPGMDTPKSPILAIPEETSSAIFSLLVIWIPGFTLILGLTIWWFRRVRW